MVQVRAHQPINDDGSINLEAWLDHAASVDPALDREALKEACEFARDVEQQANPTQNLWVEGTSSFRVGLEIAERLRTFYVLKRSNLGALAEVEQDEAEDRMTAYMWARGELLDAERAALDELRRSGAIDEEMRRRVERDLDLQEVRWR